MSYSKEKLIPVRSEGELRAGMTVVVKNCRRCGSDHALVLLTKEPSPGSGCKTCFRLCVGWGVAGGCKRGTRYHCFLGTIPQGRLFRLDTGIDEEADRRQARADSIKSTALAIHLLNERFASFNNWITTK